MSGSPGRRTRARAKRPRTWDVGTTTAPTPVVHRRRFSVRIDVEIEIDERLLASVLTEAWRAVFYRLLTAEDVASHLAYNLVQDRKLTSLDGFADQPEDAARILDIDVVDDDDVEEIPTGRPRKPPKKRAKAA